MVEPPVAVVTVVNVLGSVKFLAALHTFSLLLPDRFAPGSSGWLDAAIFKWCQRFSKDSDLDFDLVFSRLKQIVMPYLFVFFFINSPFNFGKRPSSGE